MTRSVTTTSNDFALEQVQRFVATPGRAHLEALLHEQVFEKHAEVALVVDREDPGLGHASPDARPLAERPRGSPGAPSRRESGTPPRLEGSSANGDGS